MATNHLLHGGRGRAGCVYFKNEAVSQVVAGGIGMDNLTQLASRDLEEPCRLLSALAFRQLRERRPPVIQGLGVVLVHSHHHLVPLARHEQRVVSLRCRIARLNLTQAVRKTTVGNTHVVV